MGLLDGLKRGTGMSYLDQNQEKPNSKKAPSGVGTVSDRELKKLESKVSKAIQVLQDVQEKLRVKRGY